jgi:hypothetical protein
MTTPVRTLSIASVVLLVAALALALVAATSAAADETPDRPHGDRGWAMTDDADRPMMDRGESLGRRGAMDADRMREHHGSMIGDELMRERHREMGGQDHHHGDGPMHDDAEREGMREDCAHGNGPERARERANASTTMAS